MSIVTLGEVIEGSKAPGILGVKNRAAIIGYIKRGLDLAVYTANYNVTLATLDVCSDECGNVTLPSFVGTVLQVNVGGWPTIFRNDWYNFHINGAGDRCGNAIGFSTDNMWSPVFQDLKEWSVLAAICEDATDGNGTKELIVQGETMDGQGNIKPAITIPASGPSTTGVKVTLLDGVANSDSANPTWFRNITQITKPVTRGYVKLLGTPMRQFALATTLAYMAPNETNPRYRRIKVGQNCKWVRIRYRRAFSALVDDFDIVPISSFQAMMDLIKSIQLSDSGDIQSSEAYLAKAVRLLGQIQSVESGSTYSPLEVDPSFGIGLIDYR